MPYHPLQNYRVLDFTWVVGGPLVGMLLADMGAEVIKIETRTRIDALRFSARNLSRNPRDPEADPSFHMVNRNRLGITIDMTDPGGAAMLKELAKISDVVVENFSPGVLAKYGLGYESLEPVNPQIVMLSLSGSGQDGPMKDIVTYGPTATALSGMTSQVGYCGERPVGPWGYADPNSAIYAAYGALVALFFRQRTGHGQYIDACQWEASSQNIAESIIDYTMNGRVAHTRGNRHPAMAPHNNYPCKGDDRWVSIAVESDDEWESFCQATGHPEWRNDERFVDRYNRLANVEALDKLIGSWSVNYTPQEVTEMLQRAGVAAMAHMEIGEQCYDPHFREAGAFIEVEHPVGGKETIPNVLWQLSETPGSVQRPAPLLGQHNEYVFKELLGRTDAEMGRLVAEGVIH